MTDEQYWLAEVEIHPEQWQCTTSSFWIAGWIFSKNHQPAADVRAWLGDRLFLGLCGMPRPEIELRISKKIGPPYFGFCFLLEAPVVAVELRLEACTVNGVWKTFFVQQLSAPPGEATAASAMPLLDAPHLILSTLRLKHGNPALSWRQAADNAVTSRLAHPLNTLPNPPFYGALERITDTAFVRYGRILLTGWLAHQDHAIKWLTAFIEPTQAINLIHGLPREDAGAAFAHLKNVGKSQFAGYMDVPRHLPRPLAIKIFAELENGHIELAFSQRFEPINTTGPDTTLPTLSYLKFARASLALWQQAHRRHQPLLEFQNARHLAWADYKMESPIASTTSRDTFAFVSSVSKPANVIIVTHNLNLEGAPLIAYEYACYLSTQLGWKIKIISPEDGPLREIFHKAGITVELIEIRPLWSAVDIHSFEAALASLTQQSAWKDADLIMANTMVSFWAIHLAHLLGKASLFYIHESTCVRHFFAPYEIAALIPKIEQAFGLANHTVFSARAAQAIHARLERHHNFLTLPGWIDVQRIKDYIATSNRDQLRKEHGFPSDAIIFANIGSVSERKGQHIFVEAIRQFVEERMVNTPTCIFLMVGASPSPYLEILRHEIEVHRLKNIQIISQIADPRLYYRMADIFVCSSFEEALPRVIMEAAAFALPIVSTNVNGITEIVDQESAWLIPAGDPHAMTTAMQAAVKTCIHGDHSRVQRAQQRIEQHFASSHLLPKHRALIESVLNRST